METKTETRAEQDFKARIAGLRLGLLVSAAVWAVLVLVAIWL